MTATTADHPATDTRTGDTTPTTFPTNHRQVMTVLVGLLLALFVSALSATVVATALPTMVGQLGGQDKLPWVMSATLLTMTVATPLWGKLSDLYGRKRLYLLAIALFVVASALAGLAQNIEQLIGARAVQGVGAGGLQALSQAIVADLTAPRERARYTGYLGASLGMATVAGPLIGGVLVDAGPSGWRWCFYIVIPIALLALIVVHRTLRLPTRQRVVRIDYWGAAMVTGGVTAFLLLLSMGGRQFGWFSPWSVTLGLLAVGFLLVAVLVECRVPEPILPPRLFRDRTFVLTSLAGFLVGLAMFGTLGYLPLYLQVVKGLSATVSGLLMLPMVVGTVVASIVSGQAITRLGRWKIFPLVGLVGVTLGLVLLSLLHVHTPLVTLCCYLAILGVGTGLSVQVLVLATQNSASDQDLGVATSSATFFRNLGGAVGVAVFGAILNSRVSHLLPELLAERRVGQPAGSAPGTSGLLGSPQELRALPAPVLDIVREALSQGLHAVFLVGAPLAAVGWVAVSLVRESPLRSGRPRRQELAPAGRSS